MFKFVKAGYTGGGTLQTVQKPFSGFLKNHHHDRFLNVTPIDNCLTDVLRKHFNVKGTAIRQSFSHCTHLDPLVHDQLS